MAGGSNYKVFSPDVWGSFLKVYFKDKLYAAKFFSNYTADLLAQGGDTINLPNITEGPDATTLTTTTGALTDFIITETRTQMTVASWIAQSKKFSDFQASRIKGNYALQQRYLREDLAPKLAKTFDAALIGQSGQSLNIVLHTGTSIVSLSNTTITEAIRIAESYSLPLEELAWFIHPSPYWKQLFRRTALIDASQLGKALMAAPAGEVRPLGSLFGIPVYVTNIVGATSGLVEDGYPTGCRRNLLIHPRAIAYAYGRLTPDGPRLQEQSVGDALAMRIVADLMYGTSAPGKATEGVRMISGNL